MDTITITIVSPDKYQTLASRLNLISSDLRGNLPKIANVIASMAGGMTSVNSGTLAHSYAEQKSATVTFTGDPTANDTVTINGAVFTAKASGANYLLNEFDIGANVTAHAANLVTAINNSVSAAIKNIVVASSAVGVVTLLAPYDAPSGVTYSMAESMDNTTKTDWADVTVTPATITL